MTKTRTQEIVSVWIGEQSKELCKDIPYYPTLITIRAEFEKNYAGFPENSCNIVTKAVKEDTELEEVGGVYNLQGEVHAWNYDTGRKLYIDLTMDQFKGIETKIVVIPVNNFILRKTDEWTRFQRAIKIKDRYFTINQPELGALALCASESEAY